MVRFLSFSTDACACDYIRQVETAYFARNGGKIKLIGILVVTTVFDSPTFSDFARRVILI
jgi:hypothetical protein